MKGIYITSMSIVFLCMVLFPLLSMKDTVIPSSPDASSGGSSGSGEETIRLYLTSEDKVVNIPFEDYVKGVVAAEMSADNNAEALKAQAVAAYTFAYRRKEMRTAEKYDVSDSYATDQAYLSDASAKEKWGDSYDVNMKKISDAADAVKGQLIKYNGEPILAVYHSISGGKTESAENVWGEAYPYLVPVESVGDVLSPNYLSTVTFTADEIKTAMSELGITFSENAAEWFGEKKCSDSGTVLTLPVCGTEVKGTDIRAALGLRSANFDVSFSEDSFTFTVRGYGHGVGMSQYGAQFMAQQGSTYEEILCWYYPGCQITK